MSLVRQNYSTDCEAAINKQINLELYASYCYLSMAYYFGRCDVALPGHFTYFKKASDEERKHALKFLDYQNKRGGQIVWTPIANPPKSSWPSAYEAMKDALSLEKEVNEALLGLHELAALHTDSNLTDFLETEYLQEQVDSIEEIANNVTQLERVGEGVGVHIFDREIGEKALYKKDNATSN